MTETTYVPTNIRLAHRGYEASAVIDPTDGYLQGMVWGPWARSVVFWWWRHRRASYQL